MNRIASLAVFVAALSGFSAPVMAQNAELDNARALIRESRDTIIREDLRLTDEEAARFWPLYEEYRGDLMPIQDRYIELIADYIKNYEAGTLSDAYADELLNAYFDIKGGILQTRKRYIRRFKRILPSLKVARFYQLENKMNADMDIELALLVPLVESK